MSRTPNPNREIALARGEKHFTGNPCKKCGGTLWYARSFTCAACSNKTKAKDFETFQGVPCSQGHTTRYVSTRRCVECHRQECKERREIVGSEYNVVGTQKRREEREMRERVARRRAERTARQKACAYGVPI